MTTNEKIQYYRKKLGLSQEELGQKLLVSRQTVSLWENGQTAPTIDNLKRLKEIFGVSVDELLGCENETEEESVQPNESYSINYSKAELKEIYVYNSIHLFKRPLIFMAVTMVIMIVYVLLNTIDFVIGLFSGFCLIYGLILLKQFITYKKAWKKSIDRVSESKYEYRIYDDYFTVDIIRNSELVRTEKIAFCDIQKAYDFGEEKYIILDINNQLYILRKSDIAKNSAFHMVLYNSTKQPDKNKFKKLTVAANVFFVLSALIIVVIIALSNSDWTVDINYWIFFLLLPIPITCIVLGLILKKKGIKYIKNITAGIAAAFMLLAIGYLFSWIDNDSYNPIEYLTDMIGVNLPETVIEENSISYDYKNQPTDKGFIFRYTEVLFEDFAADNFESNIMYDTRWLTDVPENLKEILSPLDYDDRHKNADLMLLYNEYSGQYNALAEDDELWNYTVVYYYIEDNRAEIFEYEYNPTVELEEQDTEKTEITDKAEKSDENVSDIYKLYHEEVLGVSITEKDEYRIISDLLLEEGVEYRVKVTFSEKEKIENQISKNSNWDTLLTHNLYDIIPFEFGSAYDYVLVYNVDTGEYNSLPEESGTYNFVSAFYYGDDGRLWVTKYSVEYTEK